MPSEYTINNFRNLFREKLADIYVQPEIDSIFSIAVEAVLGFDRTRQVVKGTEPIMPEKVREFKVLLDRLLTKEPIQYILGHAEFYGLTFKVTRDVLIPRQETELLVDYIIKENSSVPLSILDIGTGSGCIAISIKKNLNNTKITAIDISEAALSVASENAKHNEVSVDFKKADILDQSFSLNKFDIIVSNPPYIMELEKDKMHANVLEFEPNLALFVPNTNSLKFYRAISRFSQKHLNQSGSVWVEINEALGEETSDVFHKAGFLKTSIIKDLNGKDRFIQAKRI
jgi:release factor glutamine methyltransferase